MLQALPPLTSTLRYGDVRQTDTAALASVVHALAERVIAGLGPACAGVDYEAAEALADEIVAATQALGVLADEADSGGLVDDWWAALRQLPDRHDVAPLIAGTVTRLSLSAERMSAQETEERLGRALARGTEPADAAHWLEGFLRLRLRLQLRLRLRFGNNPKLGGSGLVLATSSGLFKLIDSWLVGLPAEYFEQVLPLLRRTTATFSTGERQQIAERVRNGASSVLFGGGDDLDVERAALVEPIVLAILGIEQ
jgi:hypothetical protein